MSEADKVTGVQTDEKRALEEALAERNRLWEELNRRQADVRELEHLRAELENVNSSRIWTLASRYGRIKRVARVGLERLRRG